LVQRRQVCYGFYIIVNGYSGNFNQMDWGFLMEKDIIIIFCIMVAVVASATGLVIAMNRAPMEVCLRCPNYNKGKFSWFCKTHCGAHRKNRRWGSK